MAWFLSLSCICDLENLELVGSHKDKCPSHAYVVKELMLFSIRQSVLIIQVLKPLKNPRLSRALFGQKGNSLYATFKFSVNCELVE